MKYGSFTLTEILDLCVFATTSDAGVVEQRVLSILKVCSKITALLHLNMVCLSFIFGIYLKMIIMHITCLNTLAGYPVGHGIADPNFSKGGMLIQD